jgi:hypothetical protein
MNCRGTAASGGELCVDQTTWDDYYYGAMYDFVGGETSDAAHLFNDAKLPLRVGYREKCKRFRTDGPTPCLCCPDKCVGDFPGHTYKEACNHRDGAMDGGRLDHLTVHDPVLTRLWLLVAFGGVCMLAWAVWAIGLAAGYWGS